MISPTTPGGRASRSASVGARGLGLVVLMALNEGSTGGAVLAGPDRCAPSASTSSRDLETTPRHCEARDVHPRHRLASGSHVESARARPFRTPHRRRATPAGTTRLVTARDPTTGLSSHSRGQGFDPP